jgi:glycerol-3-phosphate cytidylyltransferase
MKDRDKTIIRGFTCGTMDLLHAGHILMLKEVKEQCHYLVVGLHTDPTIDRPDKNKPVQSVEERRIQLEAVKYVDEIVEYDTEEDLVKLLKEISPQVRFVGEDWKDNPNLTGIDLPIKIVFNTRDHNYSSTELRHRILNK